MNESCPYLQSVESDLQSRKEWDRKDTAIMKKRLGERPSKRNNPYPGAPNTVDPVIDDLTRDKTDQEISMILNAPYIAIFHPTSPVDVATIAIVQKAFDTFLRHGVNYRPKKEEAVDTKNARGFAITKLITEEHPDWGLIPSFETVDPKDLIVPSQTREIRKAERATGVLRISPREMQQKPWNKSAVKRVLAKLRHVDEEGNESVSESGKDNDSTFRVTRELIGLNKSDLDKNEIVIWEVCHYAVEWDVEHSNGIVSKGDKCISWVCPDVPEELLHTVRWIEEDSVEAIEDVEAIDAEILAAELEQRDIEVTITTPGKDKDWPYAQHRYEYRSRLWYDSRGIGQMCMDNQIIATAVQNAKLVRLDYGMKPMFQGGANPNQQNVVIKPGAILPEGVTAVNLESDNSQLTFESDYQRRIASQRTASGSSTYSAEVNSSRKLEKSATQVLSEDAKGDAVSSASVDRFNDADRELFRMLWAELKRMKVRLPIISNGNFEGFIEESVYDHDFIIVPAGSQKTLNPDSQFLRTQAIVDFNAQYAQASGADIGAGAKRATEMVDPQLASEIYPDPEAGQLPIYSTIIKQQEEIDALKTGQEKNGDDIDKNADNIDSALNLGAEIAGVL